MSTTTSRVTAILGEVATDGALRAERGLSGLVGEEIRIRRCRRCGWAPKSTPVTRSAARTRSSWGRTSGHG